MAEKRTLVLGLGNPILGDDGVGWRVVETVRPRLQDNTIEVDCLAVGGLSLMERLIGYDRVILVDAMNTGSQPVGSVRVFSLSELPHPQAGHTSSAHDTSLQKALEVAQELGERLPDEIYVVAIEARQLHTFSEELSPEVQAALPIAARRVMELCRGFQTNH